MLHSLAEDFGVRYNQMIHFVYKRIRCISHHRKTPELHVITTKKSPKTTVKMNPSEILRASFYIYYKSKIGPYSKITAQ